MSKKIKYICHHGVLFLPLLMYIYLILLNVTIGAKSNKKYYTIVVFQNGENLNINHGVKVNISMYDLKYKYNSTATFGAYLQKRTNVLPLNTKLKHFLANDGHTIFIECRNKYGLSISGLNITYQLQHVFLLLSSSGSNWMWYTFPTSQRIILNDITVEKNSHNKLTSPPPVEIECLSSSPKVFKVYNLLSDEECDELIQLGKARGLKPSSIGYGIDDYNPTVVDDDDEEQDETADIDFIMPIISDGRTSETVFDNGKPLAIKIKKRISKLIRMPYDNSESYEGIQILRYNVSKAYDLHEDYFLADANWDMNFDVTDGGTNRYLTVMLYLNDVESGGETIFPLSPNRTETKVAAKNTNNFANNNNTWEQNLTKICQDINTLTVKPTKGGALLFYSLDPYSIPDKNSLHGGCPVLKGTKYAANIWVWSRPNGFYEKECTNWYSFDIINQVHNEQLAVFSYTKTGCIGCERASLYYHGRIRNDGHLNVFACKLDIHVAVVVPTEHLRHNEGFDLTSLSDKNVVFTSEPFVLANTLETLHSKEIHINGYDDDDVKIQNK
jgi:prolyl 4-hydroxylase